MSITMTIGPLRTALIFLIMLSGSFFILAVRNDGGDMVDGSDSGGPVMLGNAAHGFTCKQNATYLMPQNFTESADGVKVLTQ